MEMEKRINSQEQEEDVIDLMEIARLLLHKWKGGADAFLDLN